VCGRVLSGRVLTGHAPMSSFTSGCTHRIAHVPVLLWLDFVKRLYAHICL